MTLDPWIKARLRDWGYGAWRAVPVTGDASSRRYFRLDYAGQSRILMDAHELPPQQSEQFCLVADYLRDHGLRAPQIFEQDLTAGYLVLEDFGSLSMASAAHQVDDPKAIYRAALGILHDLRRAPLPPFLQKPDAEGMMKMLDLFFDFYVAKSSLTKESRTSFEQAFVPLLERVCEQEQVISLRDYHAENLMVLGDGAPPVALGILDFQDAFICHSAYDVVSLLQDARRDLDQASTETLLNEFIQQSPREREEFLLAYHVLGLQRNMRILGIFRCLAREEGKSSYLRFEERVKSYLRYNARWGDLRPLSQAVETLLNTAQRLDGEGQHE